MKFENINANVPPQEPVSKLTAWDKAKNTVRRVGAAVGVGTALLSAEGCTDKEHESKLPKSPDPIVEKSSTKKTEDKFLNAGKIEMLEKQADNVVMGYLEMLSNNSLTGDRMEMDANGNIFIEVYGWFYQLTKSDQLRLRSIVMRSALPPNASSDIRSDLAEALKIKIDLDISAHARKVTDFSVLPSKIKAHYENLEIMGLIKDDNKKKTNSEIKAGPPKGKVHISPDFDKDGDF
jgi:hypothetical protein